MNRGDFFFGGGVTLAMFKSSTDLVNLGARSLLRSIVFISSLSHIQLFCNPMDGSPPDSSVHRISQARILEWVAISFFRGSF